MQKLLILTTLGLMICLVPAASAQGASFDLSAKGSASADLPDHEKLVNDARAKVDEAKGTIEGKVAELEATATSTIDEAKGEVGAHASASASAGGNVFANAFAQVQQALASLAEAIGSIFASAEAEARVE